MDEEGAHCTSARELRTQNFKKAARGLYRLPPAQANRSSAPFQSHVWGTENYTAWSPGRRKLTAGHGPPVDTDTAQV